MDDKLIRYMAPLNNWIAGAPFLGRILVEEALVCEPVMIHAMSSQGVAASGATTLHHIDTHFVHRVWARQGSSRPIVTIRHALRDVVQKM